MNALFGWRGIFFGGAITLAVVAAAIMVWVRNTPPGAPWQKPQAADGSLRVIFRNGAFWRIAVLSFWMDGLLLAMQGLWAGPYFADLYGAEQVVVGNLLFVIAVGAMIGFGGSGWPADRFGVTYIVIIGATL